MACALAQVYQGAESVEQLMARLRSMKDSSDPREQEVFSCMINNLFDEYRFFHKYPDKELQITAALFGSLISQQLIEQRFLGEALRYLLDALVHPAGHKMCTFALQALHKFQDHLGKWPSYCKALLQVRVAMGFAIPATIILDDGSAHFHPRWPGDSFMSISIWAGKVFWNL